MIAAPLADFEEDACATVVVADVAEDADVGVVAVEPDAVGGDVVGASQSADRAADVAGNALHSAGVPAAMKPAVVVAQQRATFDEAVAHSPMPRPVLPL